MLTFFAVVIPDTLDGVADNLLVIDRGLGGDFAADQNHAGLSGGLWGTNGLNLAPM